MPGLLTIPRELQINIAEYLTTNRDKKSICLVCKEMAVVGTPLLYTNMVVHVDRLNDLVTPLSRPGDHRGLIHIRRVRVDTKYSDNGYHDEPEMIQKVLDLCSLLSAIPANALTRFDLVSNSWVLSQISETLYRRQRRLTNYHLPFEFPMAALDNDMLACITSVRLNIRTDVECRQAASILRCTLDITELFIEFLIPAFLGYHQSTYAERCRARAHMLFRPDEVISQFPRLRCLFVKHFALKLVAPILSQSMDLSKLEEVRLVDCHFVGHMLLSLSLEQVDWKVLYIDEAECSNDRGKLKSFVQTMNAPRTLAFGRQYTHYYEEEGDETHELCWKDYTLHSSTLKSLRANIEHTGGGPFSNRSGNNVADFDDFCKSASNLDQLAVISPDIEEESWHEEHGFSTFLDCLTSVTTLTTLELFVFPECLVSTWIPYCKCGCRGQPTDNLEVFSVTTVNLVFTRAANKVFQTLGPSCPAFTALLFRAQDRKSARDGICAYDLICAYDHLFAFTRSLKIDESGDATYEAMRVEPHMLKHYEPRSEILDMDGRRLRQANIAKKRAEAACVSGKSYEYNSESGTESGTDSGTWSPGGGSEELRVTGSDSWDDSVNGSSKIYW